MSAILQSKHTPSMFMCLIMFLNHLIRPKEDLPGSVDLLFLALMFESRREGVVLMVFASGSEHRTASNPPLICKRRHVRE